MLTIEINMDRKCVQCRRGGATQGGLCLKCIIKNLRAGKYDHILNRVRAERTDKSG